MAEMTYSFRHNRSSIAVWSWSGSTCTGCLILLAQCFFVERGSITVVVDVVVGAVVVVDVVVGVMVVVDVVVGGVVVVVLVVGAVVTEVVVDVVIEVDELDVIV